MEYALKSLNLLLNHFPFNVSLLFPLKTSEKFCNTTYAVFSGTYFPVFSPNTEKYGPEKTPYLDNFRAGY